MAGIFGISISWMALSLGAMGLSVPPQPETPLIAKVAPENCVFYMSSAGRATPDINSSNQTEQLLAEPEVQRFVAEIERVLPLMLGKAGGPGGAPQVTEEMSQLIKAVLNRPAAVYVSSVSLDLGGVAVRAGAIVKVSDDGDTLKTALDETVKKLTGSDAESVDIDGLQCQRAKVGPNITLVWGVKGKYLLLAVGDEEMKGMLKRARGPVPEWLTELHKDMPVDRVSTVTYVNLRTLIQFANVGGAGVSEKLDTLGFNNLVALRNVTGLDNECYVTKTQIVIDGEPQGLLAMGMASPLTASDLANISQDVGFAVAARINAAAIFDWYMSLAEKFDPASKATIMAGLAMVEQNLGVKVRDELLDSLGDAWVLTNSASEGPSSVVLAISLKDSQKFTAAYNKLMAVLSQSPWKQQPGGQNAPSLEKLPGTNRDVYYFAQPSSVTPITLAWCVTDKELVLSTSPQSLAAYAPKPASASLAQVPEVSAAVEAATGPVAVSYINLPKLFEALEPMWAMGTQMATAGATQKGVEFNASTIPSSATIKKHLRPCTTILRRSANGIELIERTPLPGVGPASTGPFAAGLFLLRPDAQTAREAARQVASTNNMKQIGLAMHNYAFANKTFPPAFKAGNEGKPLLSWRVMILPFLEENNLYNEFHLDEPWDSEHNRKLIARMPAIYRCPNSSVGNEGKTNYLTVRNEKSAFPGDKPVALGEITDGLSNTIMTVEVSDDKAVIWTKPDDFEYDETNPLNGLLGLRPNGFLAGLCDGSVRILPATLDAASLIGLFTRGGGEAVSVLN